MAGFSDILTIDTLVASKITFLILNPSRSMDGILCLDTESRKGINRQYIKFRAVPPQENSSERGE